MKIDVRLRCSEDDHWDIHIDGKRRFCIRGEKGRNVIREEQADVYYLSGKDAIAEALKPYVGRSTNSNQSVIDKIEEAIELNEIQGSKFNPYSAGNVENKVYQKVLDWIKEEE